jgi:hypothetical protein
MDNGEARWRRVPGCSSYWVISRQPNPDVPVAPLSPPSSLAALRIRLKEFVARLPWRRSRQHSGHRGRHQLRRRRYSQ